MKGYLSQKLQFQLKNEKKEEKNGIRKNKFGSRSRSAAASGGVSRGRVRGCGCQRQPDVTGDTRHPICLVLVLLSAHIKRLSVSCRRYKKIYIYICGLNLFSFLLLNGFFFKEAITKQVIFWSSHLKELQKGPLVGGTLQKFIIFIVFPRSF